MSVRKHTLTNLVGSLFPIVVMLFTVPLYLKLLGDARFGVMTLIWLLLGYFSFLEMGLGRATANQIAKAVDMSTASRSEIFWTALLINAFFGTVGALVLWLAGDYLLSSVLKMPSDFQQEAIAALPWMIATLPLALISSVLNGALEGRNQFFVVNVLQVVTNTVFQVVPLVVAYLYSPSLAVVVPVAVCSRTLMNVPFLIACYKYLPLKLIPHFSIERAKALTNYGGWVAVTGMISPLMETLDRFLIGAVLGVQAVTHYTLPYQLVTKLRIFPTSISRALFPKFSNDSAHNSLGLAETSFRALLLVMTLLVVMGIVFLKLFMQIWVGKSISDIAAPLGVIFFWGVWINSLAHVPFHLLQAQGRPDLVAKLHTIEVIPFIFILYSLITTIGLIGAAIAWVIRVTLDAVILFWLSGMLRKNNRYVFAPSILVIASIGVSFVTDNQDIASQIIYQMPILFFLINWASSEFKTLRN